MAAKKYRSLVVGAGSPIGARLAVLLARAGHDVIAAEAGDVLDIPGGRARARFESARDAGAWVQTADVCEAGALDPLLKDVDFMFLAARPREGDRSWKGQWRSVVQGTGNALDSAARVAGRLRRVAVFSSATVAGITGAGELDESATPDPRSKLARAMSLGEYVVRRRCAESGVRYTILRPGHLIGADAGLPLSALFRPSWLPAMPVPGTPAGQVPLCHLDDACGAAVHLAKYTSGENATIFVADGSRTSVDDLLRLAATARGMPVLPLPGVKASWLAAAAAIAVRADGMMAARRKALPFLDPDLAEVLSSNTRISTANLNHAGYQIGFPDPGVGLAAMGAAVRGESGR